MRFFDHEQGFTEGEWAGISATMEKLCPPEQVDGFIHANHYHHSLGAICRITEKLHRKHTLSLVVVDYLQLVQCDLGKSATRENVVSTISRTLKLLAQRLGVPVLALSQLNRESAKRGDPKAKPKVRRIDPMAIDNKPEPTPRAPPPQLHDLRESGAIEQDANAVVFLHHPLSESGISWERDHGPFELIVAAQRLGPTGSVSLHAERHYSRFKEMTRD
jgi:replicative DNA helicase